MRKLSTLVLLLALVAYSTQVVPQPGALELSLNLKGLSNMFGMLFPIILQQTIQNKTFDIDFTDSGALYKLQIKDILIEDMYFQTKTLTFVEGKPNTIRLNISGFDLQMKIDGAIYALWFIPLKFASLNATGISLIVDLEATPEGDQVNWQLKDVSSIDIKDFRLKVTSSFF